MSALDLYPGALWHPSEIEHPMRRVTLGVVIHWTVGRVAGDLAVLDGPSVDCHFYVTKAGVVYQMLDPDSQAWHAKSTANATCVGIETEGSGEAWTDVQLAAIARLTAWLCKRYAIPVVHADPSGNSLSTFRGIFGHRDLSLGGVRVDGNDHTDSVPTSTGWSRFLSAVDSALDVKHEQAIDLGSLPRSGSLRLVLRGRYFGGWEDAAGPILWVNRRGANDPNAIITWAGRKYLGPVKVTNVCRHLARKYLGA